MSEYLEFQMRKQFSKNDHYLSRFGHGQGAPRSLASDTQRDQLRALQLLKDTILSSINIVFRDKSCCSDDSFLNRFLNACKFQCDAAVNLLVQYLHFKEQHRSLLQGLHIFDVHIQSALRDGNPTVLKQRDRRGRKVITFATANWDPCKYTLEDVFRALLLTLDKLLENVQNQTLGFVVIVDWTNFTFKQSTFLSPKTLRVMIDGLQNCFPAKFKGIHFIAQPWYVDIALAVIKPFLKEKIKRRIIIHGSNLSTLHAIVNKDVLPPDLGGEGPMTNTLDWYHYLIESSQDLDEPKTYRLIEATVYTKNPPPPPSTDKSSALIVDNTEANYEQTIKS